MSDSPGLALFTDADQSGSITISKLDLEAKTISFKIQMALSSEDIKNQTLEINVDTAHMKIKYKKVGYLKYLSEYKGSEIYKFDVDTIRVNREGRFSLFSEAGFVECNFNKPIELKKYTQIDTSLFFRFIEYFTLKTANEYEVTLDKADDTGVSGRFQATTYFPNSGETSRCKNGYFEMFAEK